MSKSSNLALLGQVMYVLKANPKGIWLRQIARQCSIPYWRVKYLIWGTMRLTAKNGWIRYPDCCIADQVYIIRTEGNNKLIALKKEGGLNG